MRVYNKSKETIELAKQQKCPRCKGYGSLIHDNGSSCQLCNGNGRLWISNSGWTRALYKKIEYSVLY